MVEPMEVLSLLFIVFSATGFFIIAALLSIAWVFALADMASFIRKKYEGMPESSKLLKF